MLLHKSSFICLYLVNSDEIRSPISLIFGRISARGRVVSCQQIPVLIVIIILFSVLVIYVLQKTIRSCLLVLYKTIKGAEQITGLLVYLWPFKADTGHPHMFKRPEV